MAKNCKTCGIYKSDSDFPIKRANPDGLSAYCRDCQSADRAARAGRVATRTALPDSPVAAAIARTTAADDYVLPADLTRTVAAIRAGAAQGKPAPNLLFTGPSGSGKTEAAKDIARKFGLPFFKVDAPAITDPEVWFGTREVVVKDGAPMTVYNESTFAQALRQPCVLLLDEGNRVADVIRGILLPVLDDSRAVTNPLTGEVIERHPECLIVITANVGLAFTGTFAIDPAFLTRALTTNFSYLDAPAETRVAVGRTGCSIETAELFVRFANETRDRARNSDDFPPISTREVLAACELVAWGLDPTTAAQQAIINAASNEGGADSTQASLVYIWGGINKPSQFVPAP